MRNLVLRKRSRDRDFVCTTYFVPEEAYVFTLEGCDEKIEAIFRNAKGDPVAVLSPGESVSITRRGKYLICLEGRNALGSLWVEWVVPGSTGGGTGGTGENCCDELRAADTNILNQINDLRTQIQNLQNQINNINQGEDCCDELRQAIQNLQTQINNITNNQGQDCCDELRQEINNIKTQIQNLQTQINNITNNLPQQITLTAGQNITIDKNGNNYTINGQAGGGTVNPISIVAGTNITVDRVGDTYTISSTASGDVTKQYVDEQINNIKTYFENIINNLTDNDTVITITAGDNINVVKNGNDYTISSTGGSSSGGNAVIRSVNPNIIVTER